MQETRHTSTLDTRPQARAGTITGWPGSAAAWRAVPIQGAGVLTTARRCGIGTASGIDGDGPLPRACPGLASVSSAYWNQSAIDLPVAVDLARGRVALGHPRASGRAEPRAQRGVARQAQGRRLQLGVAGEHQPGDLVLDERAVARNVRGEHRATERLRLEHRVGHAALGDRAVQHDVGAGEQRGHRGVRDRTEVARPRPTGQRLRERPALHRTQHRRARRSASGPERYAWNACTSAGRQASTSPAMSASAVAERSHTETSSPRSRSPATMRSAVMALPRTEGKAKGVRTATRATWAAYRGGRPPPPGNTMPPCVRPG